MRGKVKTHNLELYLLYSFFVKVGVSIFLLCKDCHTDAGLHSVMWNAGLKARNRFGFFFSEKQVLLVNTRKSPLEMCYSAAKYLIVKHFSKGEKKGGIKTGIKTVKWVLTQSIQDKSQLDEEGRDSYIPPRCETMRGGRREWKRDWFLCNKYNGLLLHRRARKSKYFISFEEAGKMTKLLRNSFLNCLIISSTDLIMKLISFHSFNGCPSGFFPLLINRYCYNFLN